MARRSPASEEAQAVLFDSGGVLMRPIGARWNPRASLSSTPDSDDYHRVLLRNLGTEPTPQLLADLRREVPADRVLELYPDARETLEELSRRQVRMAVVSDAWPDLPDLHAALGIHHFFEAYAISAELGCNKPDPRIYHHASTALGLTPPRCLFIDDDPDLFQAAIELGYAGRAINRDSPLPDVPPVPSIATLTELLELF
ncbi:HAD-IA family hydrolase [Streptomyces sp. NPDC044571]|uniref:HAD family hydrolase n=1 Tax=Streptomyces sp. NPDC044571 TaxID=3155371 RepID=UPI0033F15377